MDETQPKGSQCRYFKTGSMDVKFSNLGDVGGTSYIPLSTNHRSNINVENTKDI